MTERLELDANKNKEAPHLIAISLVGYLIGTAYVIGKIFYHGDVRQHGSGNLGGTNTGRVLGCKAGIVVMTLDLLKVTLVVLFLFKIVAFSSMVSALSAVIWLGLTPCHLSIRAAIVFFAGLVIVRIWTRFLPIWEA